MTHIKFQEVSGSEEDKSNRFGAPAVHVHSTEGTV